MTAQIVTERGFVIAAVGLLSLYALTRLEAIFPLIQDGQLMWRPYDIEGFLARYPDGLWGMIPAGRCGHPSPDCAPAMTAEIGRLADPMMSSGFVFAILGLWMSLWLEPLYAAMSRQLRAEEILRWTPRDDAAIEARRRLWSRALAGLVGGLMLVGMAVSKFGGLPAPTDAAGWEFLLASVAIGALAGHRLGASAAYGTVARRLNAPGRAVALIVGHADGAGGARRVGEFLAFQGVLVAVPVGWLCFWLALVWQIDAFDSNYGYWKTLHSVLLAVALAVAWLGFVRPLRVFSSHYRAAKDRIVADWTQKTAGALEEARRAYHTAPDWQAAKAAVEACEEITALSGKIAALSSVPLRPAVRGLFSLATLFPVLTFVVELMTRQEAGMASLMGALIKGLAGLVTG